MFIFWGEFDSDNERGVVADKCPSCGRVTTLRVTQRYRVSHFYFIPLGSGKLIATILTCSECNGRVGGAIERYTRVLPKKTTMKMSIGEDWSRRTPT